MDFLENTYDKVLNTVFDVANPIKKSIINTHCKVHKFININALRILRNDKYISEYDFFKSYIYHINEGAVWADQDFKSSNHFYNPTTKKGLFGRKTAMDLGVEYYNESIELWKQGDFNKSLFYFGASIHIIQDMTIPQHANIRLLDNHHQYENYVKRTHEYIKDFQLENGAYLLDSIKDYIRFNARVAIRVYKKFKNISDDETRFYRTSRCTLALAERTTAGAMILFYKDLFSKDSSQLH